MFDTLQMPQIITRSKTRLGSKEIDTAFKKACLAVRGVTIPLPVIIDGRHIGYVIGERGSLNTYYIDRYHCAFTSYDDLINEVTSNGKSYTAWWAKSIYVSSTRGYWVDLWSSLNNGVRGDTTGTANTAVQCSDTTSGALYHGGNVSTDTKHLLSWSVTGGDNVYMLYDRVLMYNNCVANGSTQTMTNGVAAQRYISAGQGGLQIVMTGFSADSTPNNATAFNSLRYTDQDGNATQAALTGQLVNVGTANNTNYGMKVISPANYISSNQISYSPFIMLDPGDYGTRLIYDYQLTLGGSTGDGKVVFALVRPLAVMLGSIFTSCADAVSGVDGLPRIYDGACLSMLAGVMQSGTQYAFGHFRFAWS